MRVTLHPGPRNREQSRRGRRSRTFARAARRRFAAVADGRTARKHNALECWRCVFWWFDRPRDRPAEPADVRRARFCVSLRSLRSLRSSF